MGVMTDIFQTETRASLANPPDWLYNLFTAGTKTYTGKAISKEMALTSSAVYACIRILSENVGSLPLHLYRRTTEGREKAIDHQLYSILHFRPNPEMTSMIYRETITEHLVGWGNSYSNIVYDNANRVKELWPLRPDQMEVERKDGELLYKYTVPSGKIYFLSRKEVLHIPGLGFNGLIGYSVLTKARETIALALGMEEYIARFFGNDARPGIILKHPGTLSDPAKDNLRKSWNEKYQGLEKKHLMAVLEEGLDIKEIGFPPEDAQFIQGRKFEIEELGRWFQVPLHMLQHTEPSTSWGTGIDQLTRGFISYSLRPWLIREEQNFSMQLLKENEWLDYYFEHNVEGLLRGDSKARSEYYKNMFMVAAMSPNDILALENMPPVPGGDERFVPLNMKPLSWFSSGPPPVKQIKEEQKCLEHRASPPEGRTRIKKAYHRLFVAAAERIVNKETIALKRAVKKHLGQRNLGSFQDWIEEFYGDFPANIKSAFLQVIRSYAEEMQAATASEIGVEVGLSAELDAWIREYADRFSERYVESSLGQLRQIIDKTDIKDLQDAINQRADEWTETRPTKIGDRETKQAGEGVAAFVILAGGYKLVWNTAGKNCPYCDELDGMVIERGQSFVQSNTDLNPEGAEKPMSIYRSKAHPPLHDGCDCFVGSG